MKKILTLVLVLMFAVFLGGNVAEAYYTFTASEIDSMYQVSAGTLTSGPDASGNWAVTISNESGGGWGDVQVGRDATIEGPGSAFYRGSWANLTGVGSYQLYIKNTSTNNDWFMANLYVNTGYTDPNFNEPNTYYQNGWTWVAPGSEVKLTLDLSTAARLEHVSSIGFNIGTNLGEGDYKGNYLDGVASPVPIPAAVWLLGTGLVGLFGIRRRFLK